MIIKCLSTGSKGNCYVLKADDGQMLLLDVGVPIMAIKRGVEFNTMDIVGAVCTHKHIDHSMSVDRLRKMYVPVYAPYEPIGFSVRKKFGNFEIRCFDLSNVDGEWMHNDSNGIPCPCYGFLIEHDEMGRLLYVTDTELCKYMFRNVNHMLVSCNYQQDKLPNDDARVHHVLRGHMELETTKEFVRVTASHGNLVNVLLCHMSVSNADAEECVSTIKYVANGANVSVTKDGMVLRLSTFGEREVLNGNSNNNRD